MICPYNRAKQTQAMWYGNDLLDDSGVVQGYQHLVADHFEMMECPKEGCAVWREGRCHYATNSLTSG